MSPIAKRLSPATIVYGKPAFVPSAIVWALAMGAVGGFLWNEVSLRAALVFGIALTILSAASTFFDVGAYFEESTETVVVWTGTFLRWRQRVFPMSAFRRVEIEHREQVIDHGQENLETIQSADIILVGPVRIRFETVGAAQGPGAARELARKMRAQLSLPDGTAEDFTYEAASAVADRIASQVRSGS